MTVNRTQIGNLTVIVGACKRSLHPANLKGKTGLQVFQVPFTLSCSPWEKL